MCFGVGAAHTGLRLHLGDAAQTVCSDELSYFLFKPDMIGGGRSVASKTQHIGVGFFF